MNPAREVPPQIVASARLLMGWPRFLGLKEAAAVLNVYPMALDQSLWRHIGTPTEHLLPEKPARRRRYLADFD